jgi:predicted PurR-regulated permease PerM
MQNHQNSWLIKITLSLVLATTIIFILIIGKAFFIPLISAIIAWYILISLTNFYESFEIKGKKLPYYLALIIAIISGFIVISIIGSIIKNNISSVIQEIPEYQENLVTMTSNLSMKYNIALENDLDQFFKTLKISDFFAETAKVLTTLAGKVTIIGIYVIFLLLEYKQFHKKIELLIQRKSSIKNISKIMSRISRDINTYFKIKTTASLTTGILSYIVLRFFEVDFAEFWGLLIFVLNFIPTIGSIVAVIFPVTIALVQFQSLQTFFLLGAILTSIQILIGNILEPRFTGNSLNISPLVIILSLTIWGNIWGVFGMILCIPFIVITNIILSKFPQTQPLAILLSANGKINKEI